MERKEMPKSKEKSKRKQRKVSFSKTHAFSNFPFTRVSLFWASLELERKERYTPSLNGCCQMLTPPKYSKKHAMHKDAIFSHTLFSFPFGTCEGKIA